jgi:hypothetical protein
MSEIDAAIEALAERGTWICRPRADAELVRVELRRTARQRGIRLRTGINPAGFLWASTPDGLPADEPWRGAAQHVSESDVWFDVIQDAWRRMKDDRPD